MKDASTSAPSAPPSSTAEWKDASSSRTAAAPSTAAASMVLAWNGSDDDVTSSGATDADPPKPRRGEALMP